MTEFLFKDAFSTTGPEPAAPFTGLPRYNFVFGHNDPAEIPVEELARSAEKVIRENGPALAMYHLGHGPQGYKPLREFVARKLVETRAISCNADDVVLTSGSLQAMDLVNSTFLEPGDTVIVEEFTYGGAVGKLQRLGANIVAAPLDGDGIRMDALETILADLRGRGVRPKFLYTIPTVQNPTGSIMPMERRQQLLSLSERYDLPIFEDECYTDIAWQSESPPALYGLAPSRVVHIGSFSKSLAPALRVGYIVASWDVLSRVLGRKTDAGSPAIEQMVIADYFGAQFDKHLAALKPALRRKLDVMIDALDREFGTSAELFVPKGGIFLWLKLPHHVDVRSFAQSALDQGVAFNPGPEWACDPDSARSYMRLCFALPDEDTIREGVAELARICFEHTGVPERRANVVQRS
ncbi:PLP-dependent aminotransferase family protein [Microbaculum marinum]|uniref:PLP-dependent aminotransferase family protein n=1 Tax=Microbaculum marinum TaxID=1764581 RepID=A0AAW9REB1_9HYPH